MSQKHEISCWKCHEMTSLETRNEFDGCCWACGEEIDLDDYLIKAMDKRDEHYAALSAVTAERDAALASLERAYANYNQVSYASTGRGKQIGQLRAEVETLRKDAERYRWASSGVHEAETLVSIVNCHGGYAEKVAERVDVYRDAAMAAKEA
jgi:hypothetical protein